MADPRAWSVSLVISMPAQTLEEAMSKAASASLVLEQAGYDVNKVLKFIGSKPPEFFDEQ